MYLDRLEHWAQNSGVIQDIELTSFSRCGFRNHPNNLHLNRTYSHLNARGQLSMYIVGQYGIAATTSTFEFLQNSASD